MSRPEALEARVMLTSVLQLSFELPVDQSFVAQFDPNLWGYTSDNSDFTFDSMGNLFCSNPGNVGDSVTFNVTAYDYYETAYFSITVTFTAADSQPPEFDGVEDPSGLDTFTFNVAANSAVGSVGAVTATDPDGDAIFYGGGGGPFTVDFTTGDINYDGTPLTDGDTFTFTATADDYFGSDSALVTINVGSTNNIPPEFDGVEDSTGLDTYTFNLPADFSGGDVATLSATDPDSYLLTYSGSTGDFTIDTYTGTISAYYFSGSSGDVITFTATVDDGDGGTDEALITITIGGNNTAPEFDGLEQIIQIEDDMMWDGDTFEFDIPAGFAGGELGDLPATDPDTGDTLTWSISSAHGFSIDPTTGTLSYTPVLTTGTIEGLWAYVQDDSGDTYNDTDQAWVIINFAGGNSPPVAVDDFGYEWTDPQSGNTTWVEYFVLEGETLDVNGDGGVLKNDYDPDPGDSLTAHLESNGMYGSVDLSEDGSFTYTPNSGVFDGDFQGLTDTFTYYVKDSSGGPDTEQSEVALVQIDLAKLVFSVQTPDIDPNNQGIDVWVGQTVNFSINAVNVDPNLVTNVSWSIAPDYFKEYKASNQAAEVIRHSAQDLNATSVAVHWIDAGSKTVSVSANLKGTGIAKTTTVNVMRPQVTINAKTGSVGILPVTFANGAMGHMLAFGHSPANGTYGIQFRAEPQDPVGGDFTWIQVVDANVGLGPDGIWILGNGLDTDFPYETGELAEDSPHLWLDGPEATPGVHNHGWFQSSFDMNLMWTPPTGGEMVPLRKLHWELDMSAEWNNTSNKWLLGPDTTYTPYNWNTTGSDLTSHPTWTEAVGN